MPEAPTETPSPLTTADIPAAAQLLIAVGLQGGAVNVGRYLHWQPDGAWKLVREGKFVGMVTVLRFGPVGFVGCMAVEPNLQGHGIGRLLLEHAQVASRRAGVTTFLLEATPSGAHLYRKLGYITDYESAIVACTASGPGPTSKIADRAGVLALDRQASGTPRDIMIGPLVDEFPGFAIPQRGYGLVVGERLGPVIAKDPDAGREIVDRLFASCTIAVVPLANAPARTALAAHGFTDVRVLERMRLGPPIAFEPSWIWTLASPGAG